MELGKLSNPQAGLAFGFVGTDAQATPVRVPPRFASAEAAGEMVELYWAALARDVAFDQSPPIRRSLRRARNCRR